MIKKLFFITLFIYMMIPASTHTNDTDHIVKDEKKSYAIEITPELITISCIITMITGAVFIIKHPIKSIILLGGSFYIYKNPEKPFEIINYMKKSDFYKKIHSKIEKML